ncbi:halocyanin [Halobacteriales archaeon QS_1_68_17]|nr:MAG: halocyanin [Halobacteriales archaeon QS_1_68_17]
MERRRFLAAGLAAAGVAAAGCLGRSNAAGSDHDVGMSHQRFLPATYEVAPGTTVVWKNTGSRPHTVTAYDSGTPDGVAFFASGGYDTEQAARQAWRTGSGGGLDGGETYEHTFEVPGEYQYFCIPHEPGGMVGTIVVAETATRTPR